MAGRGREIVIHLEPGDTVRIVAVPGPELETARRRFDSPKAKALSDARMFIRANATAFGYLEGADPYDETVFDIGAAQQLKALYMDLDANGVTREELEDETRRLLTQDPRTSLPTDRATDKARTVVNFIFEFGAHIKKPGDPEQ